MRNPYELKSEIGRRLKSIRTSIGLNQVDFGDRVGIPQSTYSRYERGLRSLSAIDAAQIAAATATNLRWLITGEGRQPLDPPAELTWPAAVRPASVEHTLSTVTDSRLAEVLAVLADEYEELNERGREALLTQV